VDNIAKPFLIKGDVEMHGAVVFFALIGGIAAFGGIRPAGRAARGGDAACAAAHVSPGLPVGSSLTPASFAVVVFPPPPVSSRLHGTP